MSIRIRAFLSLTDLWIGVRLDRGKRRAFICLVPGLCIAVTREPVVQPRCDWPLMFTPEQISLLLEQPRNNWPGLSSRVRI